MASQKELTAMIKGKKPIPKAEPQEEKKEEKKEAKEEAKEEKKEEKEPATPDVKGAYEKMSNKPSQEQVEKWKVEYGNVFVSGFSDDEIVVWRPLMRNEYRNLKTVMAQAQPPPTQEDQEEAVADVCVLWPTPDGPEYERTFRKAGVFSTLHEQIIMASGFVHPGYAAALVAEL
jgi:hypothetical protein